MPKPASRNDGSLLQDELAKALKTYCEYHGAFWHRFPDTKSAQGNFLKAQPGDFFLLVPGQCLLIECKSTEIATSITTLAHHGEVGKRQVAKHKLWHRAGHETLYLYGKLSHGQLDSLEWHLGRNVVSKLAQPLHICGPVEINRSISTVVTLLKNSKEYYGKAAV